MMFHNEHESSAETLISNLIKFFIVFFLIVVAVVAIRFSGLLESEETTASTVSTPIQTLPTTTSIPPATTPSPTTSDTTQTTEDTAQPQTTPPATAYPPVSFPFAKETTTKKLPVTTTTTPPESPSDLDISDEAMKELIEVRYLSIDDNSRPGIKLTDLKNIVVHYTGNPRSTADQNWRNFENNKPGTSAHFIIGLDGEIIQCIPLDEVAWAIGTKEGNLTSISIECCHPDESGKFTDATYESLVRLVSWLCNSLELDRDDVLRHYDYDRQASWGIWHKECPLYWANSKDPTSHERWEAFKDDLIIN